MVHTFLKGISLEVNLLSRMEFDLVDFEAAVQPFNNYVTSTPCTVIFIQSVVTSQ